MPNLHTPCAETALAAVGLALALLAGAAPALAAPTVYTSRAAFLAALSMAPSVQTYESIAAGSWGTEISTPTPGGALYTLGGVSILSPSGINADRDFGLANTQLSTGFSTPDDPSARRLTVSLAQPANAIGLDLLDYQSPDTIELDPITLTAFGLVTVVNGNSSPGAPDFIGFIDPAATSAALVISRTDQVFYPLSFDNVTYAAFAAPVPEPASVALFSFAALLLARLRRRRG